MAQNVYDNAHLSALATTALQSLPRHHISEILIAAEGGLSQNVER